MSLKFPVAATLLFCLVWFNAFSQHCSDNVSGTKTLYHPQQQKLTVAPAGFQPVFINYVGRHGARHLTKAVNTSFTYKILLQADSAQGLTAKGKLLKAMVLKLQQVEQPNLKSISAIGKQEQAGIGWRMKENNASVFLKKGNIKITTTKEVRTEESAAAFLKGADLKTNLVYEKDNANELRFYDVSPAYLAYEKDGSWQKEMLLLSTKNKYETFQKNLAAQFFQPNFFSNLKSTQIEKFDDDVFGFAAIVPSVATEIETAGFTAADLDFYSFFTCDELNMLDLMDTATDDLLKGPGTDVSGIQIKVAVPLLVDFIKTTDNFISKKDTIAQFRFAHAETIGPFAALLGLEGTAASSKSILDFQEVYQASAVIPLSANVQWILYGKNSMNDYQIKFLLNEKEVHVIGLNTNNFPYYSWSSVRNFYLQKLKTIQVNLDDNMHGYLLNVH